MKKPEITFTAQTLNWREATATTQLAKFVAGPRRDLRAIKNALATPWTTSPFAEGRSARLR
jgi:transposase